MENQNKELKDAKIPCTVKGSRVKMIESPEQLLNKL